MRRWPDLDWPTPGVAVVKGWEAGASTGYPSLVRALEFVAEVSDCRAVVICSQGNGAPNSSLLLEDGDAHGEARVCRLLLSMPVHTAFLVQGRIAGGQVSIALAARQRFISKDGVVDFRSYLSSDQELTNCRLRLLGRCLNVARSLELILPGAAVEAGSALRLGLALGVAEEAEVVSRVAQLAPGSRADEAVTSMLSASVSRRSAGLLH